MATGTGGDDLLTLTTSPAEASGLGGNDTLTATLSGGLVLTSSLDGGAGRDVIQADGRIVNTDGATSLEVTNTLAGGTGSDTITAHAEISGGVGFYANGPDPEDFRAANVISDTGAGGIIQATARADSKAFTGDGIAASNVIHTGRGADNITAAAYSDKTALNLIHSGAGKDTISAHLGNNAEDVSYRPDGLKSAIYSGAGNDSVSATSDFYAGDWGVGQILVQAGGGHDTVRLTMASEGYGSRNDATLLGEAGNDALYAQMRSEGSHWGAGAVLEMSGGGGSDTLSADVQALGAFSWAETTLMGGGGDDQITASTHANGFGNRASATQLLSGGAGNDTIDSSLSFYSRPGETSGVTITGGHGADVITSAVEGVSEYSVRGTQRIYGGGGNDTMSATLDHQVLYGLASWGNVLGIEMDGGNGSDVMRAETTDPLSEHLLTGGRGHDLIAAIGGNDATIDGGAGNDTVMVASRDAHVSGGAGSDVIDADGAGVRLVSGGAGADRFHFDPMADGGVLMLTDWQAAVDVLVFEGVADDNGDGSIADEVNALIVDAGSDGATYWLTFAGGGQIDFGARAPVGEALDVRSYVSGDVQAQLVVGVDLEPPLLV